MSKIKYDKKFQKMTIFIQTFWLNIEFSDFDKTFSYFLKQSLMTVRLKSFEAESGLSKNVSKKAQDRKKG